MISKINEFIFVIFLFKQGFCPLKNKHFVAIITWKHVEHFSKPSTPFVFKVLRLNWSGICRVQTKWALAFERVSGDCSKVWKRTVNPQNRVSSTSQSFPHVHVRKTLTEFKISVFLVGVLTFKIQFGVDWKFAQLWRVTGKEQVRLTTKENSSEGRKPRYYCYPWR